MNIFAGTICEKNDVELARTVDYSHSLLEGTMWSVIDKTADERGEYILYNTVNFLLDEGAASLERIAQSVMLSESQIASRVTTSFAQSPDYNLQRPHMLKTNELIQESLQSNAF